MGLKLCLTKKENISMSTAFNVYYDFAKFIFVFLMQFWSASKIKRIVFYFILTFKLKFLIYYYYHYLYCYY